MHMKNLIFVFVLCTTLQQYCSSGQQQTQTNQQQTRVKYSFDELVALREDQVRPKIDQGLLNEMNNTKRSSGK